MRKISAARRRFATANTGSISILTGIFLTIALLLAAYAVDEGMFYLERREAQGLTDLAAIAAATHMDKAASAASTTLADNGYEVVSVGPFDPSAGPQAAESSQPWVRIEKGRYTGDILLPASERFIPGPAPHNAVRVTMSKTGRLFFAASFMTPPEMLTQSIAYSEARAAFSIGSRLASINGGILNALLGGLTGSNLSLSVMDYRGLLGAEVELFAFLDALSSQVSLKGGTYDSLLNADMSLTDLARAAAQVSPGNTAAGLAFGKLAANPDLEKLSVPLDKLLDLGDIGHMEIGDPQAAFLTGVNAMDLIMAAAAAATGEHQLILNLGLAVPGLASVSVQLLIGERMQASPWLAIGATSTTVRTAQTRLYLDIAVGGKGALAGTGVHLPIYVEVAYAEAPLTSVACPAGLEKRAIVSLSARPGIAEAWIGEIDPKAMRSFKERPRVEPARLASLPAIKVKGSAHVNVGNTAATTLEFNHREIASGTLKSISTRTPLGSLTGSLIRDLDVDVDIAGLGLGLPGPVTRAVGATLEPVAGVVDEVLYTLLTALGVRLGEADVRVNGIKCQRAVVVQ